MGFFANRKPSPPSNTGVAVKDRLQGQGRPRSTHYAGHESEAASDRQLTAQTSQADSSHTVRLARAIYASNDAFTAVTATYEECFRAAERLAGYRGMRSSDGVAGIRSSDVARPVFLTTEFHSEADLRALLAELRAATEAVQSAWARVLSLLPGEGPRRSIADVIAWGIEHKVGAAVMDSLLTKALFVNTDFGSTPESFWAENDRMNAVIGA